MWVWVWVWVKKKLKWKEACLSSYLRSGRVRPVSTHLYLLLPVPVPFDLDFLELRRLGGTKDSTPVALHMVSQMVGNLLIEPAQKDRAGHNRRIAAHRGQEAGAFQRDVRRPHHQGFPR